MSSEQKKIFVYDDFTSDFPILMGMLYVSVVKGKEAYSFEFDKNWLKKTAYQLLLILI